MRPKKDPGIRRDAFISASTELFIEKGYEAVSIRDVLDAVADKTASPSVFYYYFSSKDELYRSCVQAVAQAYLCSMQACFSIEGKSTAEWMIALVQGMETYLLNDRNLIVTGKSTANRLFVLDMRQQVTSQIAAMWAQVFASSFGMTARKAEETALFLAGGISELITAYMLGGDRSKEAVSSLSSSIVRMAVSVIGFPAEQQEELLAALQAYQNE